MSNSHLFQISRTDGRSNSQVICDMMSSADPGTIFSYREIGAELAKGSPRKYDAAATRQAVIQAEPRLLKEYQRALRNIRGHGYKVAAANEHNELAIIRKRRSDVQLKRGLLTLQNVRWDEMDETQRNVHQGTLIVVGALYQNQKAYERRTDKRLKAIEDVLKINK